MELITNDVINHTAILNKNIAKSENIFIAVAFLKRSGFQLIEAELNRALIRGVNVKIFCGVDPYFCITDPEALRDALHLFNKYTTGKLYLYNSKRTFHPKLYFLGDSSNASIIIGSANLTKGGFEDNVEISIIEEVPVHSAFCKEVMSFFIALEKSSIEADELHISQYQRKYAILHTKLNRARKEAEKEMKTKMILDSSKMKKYLAEYKKDKDQQDNLKKKILKYKDAEKVLNDICDKSISSRMEFMEYYEKLVGKSKQKALWHSSGLLRYKNEVASDYETFIEMVRDVRDNRTKTPEEVFDIGLKHVHKVFRLGVNSLTEVMNTYDPQKFAVLNNNPLGSLKDIGISGFPDPNKFQPETYDRFNTIIGEIMIKYGFKSRSDVDHFLNYIFHKQKGK